MYRIITTKDENDVITYIVYNSVSKKELAQYETYAEAHADIMGRR